MDAAGFLRRWLILALFALPAAAAAQRQAPEPELKAAILVNMLLFVDWGEPALQPRDRLVVCHLDDSPVSAALAQLDGKAFKGKPLRVRRVDAERIGGCHALYVAPGEAPALADFAPALKGSMVLLAGDSPDHLQRGIMLNLDIDAGRVVFDIDLRALRQAGLSLSSKVLRLARRVIE